MNEARQRAVIVATATKWLAIAAALAAPFATDGAQQVALFVLAVIGGVLRIDDRYPWLTVAASVVMVSTTAVAAGMSGGPESLGYAAIFLLAADVAIQRGGGLGALIGGLGALAVAIQLVLQPAPLELSRSGVLALALTPLIGMAFGTVHRDLPITGVVAMRATTRALDELVALSHRLRPGLDRWGVAEAIVSGLRDHSTIEGQRTGTEGPHLLISVDGVLHGVGAPWHRLPLGLEADLDRPRRNRPFRSVPRDDLPSAIAERLEAPRWLVHRIDEASGGGLVLVDARTHPAVLDRLMDTVSTAVLALANSARFEELQSLATDAARARLAADLHDGIAQALTHARFELELAAMQRDDEELRRARRAADAALAEVRRTIGELRDEVPLSEAVERHVATVRSFARVPVDLVVGGEHEPAPETGAEVLRVAQEALSNALRHSGCTRVDVELQLDRDALVLCVTDDGVGIGPDMTAGVGLAAMRERAAALGADLRIRPAPSGGTEVELEVRPGGVGPGARSAAMAGRGGPGGWLRRARRRSDDHG